MPGRLISILIISTLFFSSYVAFTVPFEFYGSYFVVVALLPIFILKYPFPKGLLTIMFPLLLFGLLGIWSGDNVSPLFFKIYLNVFVSLLFYQYVFQYYSFDVKTLFGYYLKGAYIISIIGIVQIVAYNIGFTPGYNFTWFGLNKWGLYYGGNLGLRLNSIFSEPSYFGGAIGPAFFISFYTLVQKNNNAFITKQKAIVIILAYLLTFSTVAYMGVFVVLVLLLINFGLVRYALIFVPTILFSYYYLYNNVKDFRDRVDGLDNMYSGKAQTAFEVHGSSFVQYNNYHIAIENFKRNPLIGTGLGSHQIAYDRYSLTKQFGGIYDFNKSDANSMLFRLISETGLFGLILMAILIIKFIVIKQKDPTGYYWLISNAALVAIFLQLFRQGNYTYNGFMFYLWLYYYAKQAMETEVNRDYVLPEANPTYPNMPSN